jgi:hypothetical protein
MKKIIFIVLLIPFNLYSQNLNINKNVQRLIPYNSFERNAIIDSSIKQRTHRKIFINSSVGILLEIASFGLGYQISDNLAVSIKGHAGFIGKAANGATGLGFKVSHYFSKSGLNCVNLESILYFYSGLEDLSPRIYSLLKGAFFDLNIGKENISDSGFSIFWSLGIGISMAKEADVLALPSFKIGVNFNFLQEQK